MNDGNEKESEVRLEGAGNIFNRRADVRTEHHDMPEDKANAGGESYKSW